ncbi:hypothetical protein CGRA01v4_11047 [Colletotrichum graminicola]|nr:hypothetical protein CGRA01v4_11047 [Colletotrichum graminicola]
MASQIFCTARTLTAQAELVTDKANFPWPSRVHPNFPSKYDDQTDCPSVIKQPSLTDYLHNTMMRLCDGPCSQPLAIS